MDIKGLSRLKIKYFQQIKIYIIKFLHKFEKKNAFTV